MPVELIGFDLSVSIKPEGVQVAINPLIIRNARMDVHGVGYEMEIGKSTGKSWSKGMLSRRSFGLDNFSLTMKIHNSLDTHGCDPVTGTPPQKTQRTWLEGAARAWCWKKDQELAIKALKDAFATSMAGLIGTAQDLNVQVSKSVHEPVSLNPEVLAYKARKANLRP